MTFVRWTALAIALVALPLAACGDDAEPESVEIVAVNYEFQNVPETLAVGSDLSFHNDSTNEVHEMIVVRIDDDETRPIEELVQLPEDEAEQIASTDIGVTVALPGEDGVLVDGEDLVLDEPGRYALLCFIPLGSDVEKARELLSGPPPEGDGPPPSLGDGPPHVTAGMFAEFTVEE